MQPETVELPDLKDCQTLYRLDADNSGKENEDMIVQVPEPQPPQPPIDIVMQEGIPIGIDNSKFKGDAGKPVSES